MHSRPASRFVALFALIGAAFAPCGWTQSNTPAGKRDLHLEKGNANQPPVAVAPPSGHRLALVVGNNNYAKAPLKNAVNDARAIGAALKDTGFQVQVLENASARALDTAVNEFIQRIGAGDAALFYFAGHGVQLDGENYLIPVDFDGHDEADVRYSSRSASWVQEKMERTGARLKIL